jgi:hypothetical protein
VRRAWGVASVTAATLALLALGACGGGGDGTDASGARPTRPSSAPSTATAATIPPTAAPTPAPPTFTSAVSAVTAAELGPSWREGCPVGPDQLRRVTVGYVDFDGLAQTGTLVVHADAVDAVQAVFRRLFDARFPIRRIEPVDRYGGSDDASMAADNTSAFNCRSAVRSDGVEQWSTHAFGRAIDVNPLENPYVLGAQVLPPEGAAYTDRADVRPGMAVDGGPLVDAFAASGWQWGGRWTGSPDYQHFSADGR